MNGMLQLHYELEKSSLNRAAAQIYVLQLMERLPTVWVVMDT